MLTGKWRGCLNWDCVNEWPYAEMQDDKCCTRCGEELQPFPKCACGASLPLKRVRARLTAQEAYHCAGCGLRITEQTIGPILSQNVRQLVSSLAKQKADCN